MTGWAPEQALEKCLMLLFDATAAASCCSLIAVAPLCSLPAASACCCACSRLLLNDMYLVSTAILSICASVLASSGCRCQLGRDAPGASEIRAGGACEDEKGHLAFLDDIGRAIQVDIADGTPCRGGRGLCGALPRHRRHAPSPRSAPGLRRRGAGGTQDAGRL